MFSVVFWKFLWGRQGLDGGGQSRDGGSPSPPTSENSVILNNTLLRLKLLQRDKPLQTIFCEFSAGNVLQVLICCFKFINLSLDANVSPGNVYSKRYHGTKIKLFITQLINLK